MLDESSSRYPCNDAGEIPVPAGMDWLDPLLCLSFAAAATQRIRQFDELDIAVAVSECGPRDLAELSAVGVDEHVLVEPPPGDAADGADWMAQLAERWRDA